MIGGAPAAAVVFAGEVEKRASAGPATSGARGSTGRGAGFRPGPAPHRAGRHLKSTLRAEKISEVAASFDAIHNIHRAVEGSVDAVIEAPDIRPRIISEIERGLQSPAGS